jgi:signal transduction histidine kinase
LSQLLKMAKKADSQKIISSHEIPSAKNTLLQIAKKYLEHAVQKSKLQNNQSVYSGMLESLAETNELGGDYKNAYINYKKFIDVQDSIYSQENKNKIAAATGQLEIDKKNTEISLQNLTISNQQRQKVFFIAGLFLLGTIGGLLFYQSRTRKKTNTTLMLLNNELDETNKIKTKFFSILSHDLRGPVSNLINFLHLQQHGPDLLDKESNEAHTKRITRCAENLLENMEELLLWSKGQMENFKPVIKQVAVNDLFLHVQKFFASNENIKFSFINTTNAMVTTDENYLQTIMHNLTANAVKALKNTSNAAIEWAAKQEGNKTVLSVTDNGPGLSAEQSKTLYDDPAVANSRTGMGLYIIRDLAKAIGCRIKSQSQPGHGTTFLLTV